MLASATRPRLRSLLSRRECDVESLAEEVNTSDDVAGEFDEGPSP